LGQALQLFLFDEADLNAGGRGIPPKFRFNLDVVRSRAMAT